LVHRNQLSGEHQTSCSTSDKLEPFFRLPAVSTPPPPPPLPLPPPLMLPVPPTDVELASLRASSEDDADTGSSEGWRFGERFAEKARSLEWRFLKEEEAPVVKPGGGNGGDKDASAPLPVSTPMPSVSSDASVFSLPPPATSAAFFSLLPSLLSSQSLAATATPLVPPTSTSLSPSSPLMPPAFTSFAAASFPAGSSSVASSSDASSLFFFFCCLARTTSGSPNTRTRTLHAIARNQLSGSALE